MTKRERLEDLGIICEKCDAVLEDEFFENLDSKHSFERWVHVNFQSKKLEEDAEEDVDSLGDEMYDYHMKLRHFKDKLLEIWSIARGEDE